MKFRIDINGLRAIAVLAVVLFHFAPEKLPGGFAGVDVFFVISGYLMTSIIFRGFENNNFSFWKFILNRAKRIVPALLTAVFVLLVLGYATLGPDAYKMLARHARDSLLFISNITYNNESGYFDAASNTKFLLHTWSLSVEWQFYIIYPLILLTLKRFFSISTLKTIVIGLLITSLIASIIMTKYKPETAYFMFYTRAWEMMLGGLAFLYPLKESFGNRIRFTMELVGLAIIAISVLKINTQIPWPGYMALLPVIGTYLCILANNKNTILSGYIIEKIGLWSYSIYLVHWPIIVFDHMLSWNLSFKKYIIITFVLAFISYQLIEKRRHYKWGLLVSFVVVLLMAVYIRNTNGVEQRFNIPKATQESTISARINWKINTWKPNNHIQNSKNYIFYGDSFTAELELFFLNQNINSSFLYDGECLSTPSFFSHHNSCKNNYQILKENIQNNVENILVLNNFWSNVSGGLYDRNQNKLPPMHVNSFVDILKKEILQIQKELPINRIIIIGEHTRFRKIQPKECLTKIYGQTLYEKYISLNTEECPLIAPIFASTKQMNIALKQMSEEINSVYFIDPNKALCDSDEQCRQIENHLFLHGDLWHLSFYGADIVGKYIFDEIIKIKDSE